MLDGSHRRPKNTPPIAFGLACALFVGAWAHADAPASPAKKPPPETQWERIAEKDGVTAYRREIPNSPIVAFRGEGIIDASILRVASVLVDTSRAIEWVDSLADARTLRQVSETEHVEYDHVKTPFIMKDRDFVLDTKLELDAAKKQIIVNIHSVSDPLAPRTSYVRGELLASSFILTSLEHGTKTLLVAEIQADPKGSVAKWMVNMFQKDWPRNTFARLRTQVAKTNIQEHPRLRAVLTEDGYLN